MDARALATGISLHPPTRPSSEPSSNPFSVHPSHSTQDDDAGDDETSWRNMLQQQTFIRLQRQTKSTVETVLGKANRSSYQSMVDYMVSHCVGNTAYYDVDCYPTAGIIAGQDAPTSSLWLPPLSRQLLQHFPLLLRWDFNAKNARVELENVLFQLQSVDRVREREKSWLLTEIHACDLETNKPWASPQAPKRSTPRKPLRKTRSMTQPWRNPALAQDMIDHLEVAAESNTTDSTKVTKQINTSSTKLSTSQLIQAIHSEFEAKCDPKQDVCAEQVDILLAVVRQQLQDALNGDERHVVVYQRFINWCLRRVTKSRSFAQHDDHGVILPAYSERPLASFLQELLSKGLADIRTCPSDQKDPTLETKWKMSLSKNADYYHFNANESQVPYLILCIDQLETLDSRTLADFMSIWTQANRSRRSDETLRIGFVVGVASQASPALHRLPLQVTSKVDLQFFHLKDSLKCFQDVLEALIVQSSLPLRLSGAVLRSLAAVQRRSQSLVRFRHALCFVCFDHIRSHPFSCSTLLFLQDEKSEEVRLPLRVKVFRHVCNTSDSDQEAAQTVQRAVDAVRRRRQKWNCGWRCLRECCLWLRIPLTETSLVSSLAEALDGNLQYSSVVDAMKDRIHLASFKVLKSLMDGLTGICNDHEASNATLQELSLLFQYAILYGKEDPDFAPVEGNLRQEAHATLCEVIGNLCSPSSFDEDASVATVAQFLEQETTVDDPSVIASVELDYYNELHNLLLEMANDSTSDDDILQEARAGNVANSTFGKQLGKAYTYYTDAVGRYLDLRDWKRQFESDMQEQDASATFLRALCTLRHWGLLKSLATESRDVEKLEKMVFM